jgi:hypothetical protein
VIIIIKISLLVNEDELDFLYEMNFELTGNYNLNQKEYFKYYKFLCKLAQIEIKGEE